MYFSFDDTFELLMPFIPNNLISSDIIKKIRSINQKLPGQLTTRGGFECPLNISAPYADWQLCVCSDDNGREILTGNIQSADIPFFLLNNPLWNCIRDFAIRWADPSSPLYKRINYVWLEFDLDQEIDIPVPGLFFSLIHPDEIIKKTEPEKLNYNWAMDNALNYLYGTSVKKEIREAISFCCNSLPEDGKITFMALMLSRNIPAVRLIFTIPLDKLKDYLTEIKWPGSKEELLSIAEEMSEYVDSISYNIDVSHKVLPKIGLECQLNIKQVKLEPRWEILLDHLVKRSLCTSEKRASIMDWPGCTYTTLPYEFTPCYLFRGISHIKIIYQPGQNPEAKGYIGFRKASEEDINRQKTGQI